MPERGPPATVADAARLALAAVSQDRTLAFAEVLTLGGAHAYWLVCLGGPKGLEALARVADNGKILTVGALRSPVLDCGAAATGLDTFGARALAQPVGGGAPVLVQDGPVAREAWLLRDDPGKPLLLATGGGTYERRRPGDGE
jgi:hypothetical protein